MNLLKNHSYWLRNLSKRKRTYPKLKGSNLKVDVVIVGAGITGLSTAMRLHKKNKKVAIIESNLIGSGVTSFSTAKLTSLHNLYLPELEKRFGFDTAKIYVDFNESGINYIENISQECDIKCNFKRISNYTYTTDESYVNGIKNEVDIAKRIGLKAKFVESWDAPIPIKGAIKVENQAIFEPYDFCEGVADYLHREKVPIFENSRVIQISDVLKSHHHVQVEGGSIEAENVVLATHLPILNRSGHFAVCAPVMSYCMAFRLENDNVPDIMGINPEDSNLLSFRFDKDEDGKNILIVSGNGSDLGKVEDSEDAYRDLKIKTKKYFKISDEISRWFAHDYYPSDGIPYIGKLSKITNNIFTATGFKKWGLSTGAASGILITDIICHSAYSPWEKVFDATRWDLTHSLSELLKTQMKVGYHFVGDRLKDQLASKDYSNLKNDEGGIYKVNGESVALYKDNEGKVHALSPVCSHLGCHVLWNAAERTWDCPCHGSRYNYDGQVISGPTVKGLSNKDQIIDKK